MAEGCEICERIARFTPGHPYVVAELETGYAVLGDNQTYEGYTIFLAKRCVPELHLLPRGERSTFLEEMATVAEAVFRAFSPRKLNYELLGNGVPHLHWHLFPRRDEDPLPGWPIWNNPQFLSPQPKIDRGRLDELRARLQRALSEVRGTIP
ncbi:MAG: HIT family protein [Dehalococcoidia bacterium]